jgi:hypothetical protein
VARQAFRSETGGPVIAEEEDEIVVVTVYVFYF